MSALLRITQVMNTTDHFAVVRQGVEQGMTHNSKAQFEACLQQHLGIVHKVARGYAWSREDRADLVQEIITQLWRAWSSFDTQRSVSTWMYRIALNTAISSLRSQSAQLPHVPLEEHVDTLAAPAGCDLQTEQRLQMLQAFMRSLGALDRALLLLYLDERSGREIAEVLGIGPSNVTTRINRLKQRLREFASAAGDL
jgi:RNA polymerase sigma factor (sigma-70 family)